MASALSRSVLAGRLAAGGDTKTAVERTSDDAAVSKLSAATLGYYEDEFMPHFVKGGTRRSPLINRGYFARVSAVRELVTDFCLANSSGASSEGGAEEYSEPTSEAQVVSLGAGIDTTYWHLVKMGTPLSRYVEIDLPAVVHNKLRIIRKTPLLAASVRESAKKVGSSAVAGSAARAGASSTASEAEDSTGTKPRPSQPFKPPKLGEVVLQGPNYALATADLRESKQVRAVLEEAGIDFSKPTLFLSECVLVYMPTEEADGIIRWCASAFPRAAFVCYEQVRVGDAFGAVMLAHLEKRGSPLRTCVSYPGIPDLARRYLDLGFDACTVLDMDDVYYRWLPSRPRCTRAWHGAERKELFDELEEWHMIQRHYSLAVSAKDPALLEAWGAGAGSSGGAPRAGRGMSAAGAAGGGGGSAGDDDGAAGLGRGKASSSPPKAVAGTIEDEALETATAARGAWPEWMDVRRQWAGLTPIAVEQLAGSGHWAASLLFGAGGGRAALVAGAGTVPGGGEIAHKLDDGI